MQLSSGKYMYDWKQKKCYLFVLSSCISFGSISRYMYIHVMIKLSILDNHYLVGLLNKKVFLMR